MAKRLSKLREQFSEPPGPPRIRARVPPAEKPPTPTVDLEAKYHGGERVEFVVTCAICRGSGHRKTQCPWRFVDAPVPKEYADALRPVAIAAGMRFTVVEDFTEDETGTRWRADETWEAVAPAGKDGAWRLRRVPDGAEAVGHPTLHPFQLALAGGPSIARDWRVGMREPAAA